MNKKKTIDSLVFETQFENLPDLINNFSHPTPQQLVPHFPTRCKQFNCQSLVIMWEKGRF